MDNLTFGVAIKGTGDSSLVDEAKTARQSLDDLKQSAQGLNTDWAKVQASVNASAKAWLDGNPALDAARDKAWALANGYKDVDGSLVKAAASMGAAAAGTDEVAFATARAQQEMVVLGREVASGNFSRMPGTLSIIAQGLSGPVLLGLGAVAAAAAAGAIAWESYGDSVEKLKEEFDQLADRLGLGTIAELNKQYAELEKRAQEKRADAASGGWGWQKDAADAAELERELRDVGKQIDANKQKEIDLGDAGGIASKLTLQSETAKRREIEHQIVLLQIYHDKQVAGSTGEIDSTSKLIELKRKLYKPELIGGPNDSKPPASLAGILEQEYAQEALAAKKEETAKAKHLAIMVNSENAYFAQVEAAAGKSDKSAKSREDKRFKDEIIDFQRRYEQAALDHELTLAEQEGFESALDNIILGHQARRVADGKAYALQDIATLGEKSRVFFEISKQLAVAEIIMAGGDRAEKSAAWAATWGGPIAAAAATAVSWAATAINVAKIESTQFGGGGGGSAPSGGGGGGIPISSPSFADAPSVSAQPKFQNNDTGGNSGTVIIINAPGADAGTIARIRELMPAFIAENGRVVVGTVNQAMNAQGRAFI